MRFKIGKTLIGKNLPSFIVAEMSGNHNHDFNIAVEIIYSANKNSNTDIYKILLLIYRIIYFNIRQLNNITLVNLSDYVQEKSKTLIHDYCNNSLDKIASYIENASDGVSTTGANAEFPTYKLETQVHK